MIVSSQVKTNNIICIGDIETSSDIQGHPRDSRDEPETADSG